MQIQSDIVCVKNIYGFEEVVFVLLFSINSFCATDLFLAIVNQPNSECSGTIAIILDHTLLLP